MTRRTEAIFTNGVLKPESELGLRERQRVRLTVETLEEAASDRTAALERLRAGIASMNFRSNGKLPSREELHDRD